MMNSRKIFLIVALFIFSVYASFAQSELVKKDTLSLNKKKTEQAVKGDEQKVKKTTGKQAETANKGTGSQGIKQVKGARMDMSKARGARPPDIIRPGGSRIPKGVGRPGGAIRPGRS